MSYIEVDIDGLVKCCDKFIKTRNRQIQAIKTLNKQGKDLLYPCRPERAVTLRNMALSANKFMLSMDDFIYLEKEVCPKELQKLSCCE